MHKYIIIILIAVIIVSIYMSCTFSCSQDDKEQAMLSQLEEQKNNDDIPEINEDALMELKKNDKIGMIEVNNEKREYYYPYGLYSNYYNYRPYGYHYYYPYRRYLRPYYRTYYPGYWARHYGNYYYIYY